MEIQRESIFISILRTFFRLFFGTLAFFLAFFVFSFFYSITTPTNLISEKTTPKIVSDANGNRTLVSPTAPAILQIPITGVIGDPSGINTESIENILLDSQSNSLLKNGRLKGIFLCFNTPGGTVVDSDNIYRMLMAYKAKYNLPIYAFVDGLCASGGMYIASSADKSFGGPAAVIGSVGVVMGPFFNFSDTMSRYGLQARTLTAGIDKDMMNPTRAWKEGEDASLKAVMTSFYDRFVNIVTSARPRLDREKLVTVYGAQVYDAEKAQNYGYIDEANASRESALKALLLAANIDASSPYQVIELTPKTERISNLVQGKSPLLTGKIEHSLNVGQSVIRDQFAYLYQPLENQ